MKKKLFIFDYDGVIVDSLSCNITILNLMAEKYNLPGRITGEMIGSMPSVMFDKAFELIGMKEGEFANYQHEFLESVREKVNTTPVFAGIPEIFSMIKERGDFLAVNTGNHSETVRKKLEDEGTVKADFIVGYDTPGCKSEKIKCMMEMFSALPEDTYMIGDTMGDITEGKKAGVRTVAVTYGWQTEKTLLKTEPDYICSNVQELNNLLSGFCSKP